MYYIYFFNILVLLSCVKSAVSMAEAARLQDGRIDLDHPRYDQSTFWGRAKHFFTVTDPRNLLHSEAELDWCKNLLQTYR